jgi:cellulose biosynthesis protein BcsQ
LSRFLDQVRDARVRFARSRDDWDREERPFRVLTVANNKGGIGKTTIAANLAVYLRALREDLPILILGLDDQPILDRMFEFGPQPEGGDVASALRRGTFAPAIRFGQYGVHYVPSCRDVSVPKRFVEQPFFLQTVLQQTAWRGLVILDTKSDFEILTRNALAASDLALVVVKDWPSLVEAEKVYAQLEAWGRPWESARVVLSMVNLRVKYEVPGKPDILALLLSEIRRRGFPLFESFVSCSPKVESLCTNPDATVLPVLTAAPKSLVHRQLHHLAHDVLKLLERIGLRGEAPQARSAGGEAPVRARRPWDAADGVA